MTSLSRRPRTGPTSTQIYNFSKITLEAHKRFALQGLNLEILAHDELYIESLQQATGATAALSRTALATATAGYQRGKGRALESLDVSRTTSFGARQEHRLTLTLFQTIQARWSSVAPVNRAQAPTGLGPTTPSATALPWFAVPTIEFMQFLYKQISRHCYGLERSHMRAGKQFNDMATMTIMVRMLQCCYGSNLLQKQQLLFGDRWRPHGRRRPWLGRTDRGESNVSKRASPPERCDEREHDEADWEARRSEGSEGTVH